MTPGALVRIASRIRELATQRAYGPFLATRYLLTRPINLLGMLGVTLSVWALVVVVSLFSGVIVVIEEHVHAASADVSIGSLPAGTSWSKLHDAIADDPNVRGQAPRLVHFGMLNRPGVRPPPPILPGRGALHGGDQPFLFVLGVEPAAEANVTGFADWLRDPAIPADLRVADPDDPLRTIDSTATVLVGFERMKRDGLKRGDEVVLTSGRVYQAADGNKTLEQIPMTMRVAGAYKSMHGGFDGNNVFVDRATLNRALFADDPDTIQEVAVRLRDDAKLWETADRLQRTVARITDRGDGRAYGSVQTWRQKNATFLASIEHQRALLKIVLIVIMVVAAFLMLATLSMMVTEKTSDIGILTAMGGTPIGVMQIFLSCGLVITGLGIVTGIGTGCLTAVHLEEVRQFVLWTTGVDLFPLDVYNLDRVPSSIDPWWLLQVAGMALGTGFLVSALPAFRAARHDPLVSLRSS
ncbi:MAG: ABC transporter permease [Planctomycetes bacterium]|nr:ABC transporter permease [Planctomycetota bacterium]